MAPTKSSPLKAIRRQTANHQGLNGPPNVNSAYSRLKRSNDDLDGKEHPPNVYRDDDSGKIILTPEPRPKKQLKTHIGTFSVPHPKKASTTPQAKRKRILKKTPAQTHKAPTPPENETTRSFPSPPPQSQPPKIESWRPANGLLPPSPSTLAFHELKPTTTLGIARISSWRVDTFTTALMKLLKEEGGSGGETGELQTGEFEHGGESVTDVLLVFQCEVVAEAVRERLDGCVLEGRRLVVTFV